MPQQNYHATHETISDGRHGDDVVSKGLYQRVLSATIIGNVVEWYDNGLYGVVAIIIAAQYFPNHNPSISLVAAYSGYLLAYIVRPFAGTILGRFADTWGRRNTLALTILLMSIGTAGIALIPTYHQIGFWAPALLLSTRLIQGIGAAGEYTTASTFLLEYGNKKHQNRLAGYTAAGVNVGLLIATVLAAALSGFMPSAAFASWGWRLLFLLAVPMAMVGYYIRKNLDDVPEFKEIQREVEEQSLVRSPFKDAIKGYWKEMLMLCGVTAANRGVAFALSVYFIAALVNSGFASSSAWLVTSLAFVVVIIALIVSGFASDRFGGANVLKFGYAYLVILMVPMFLLIDTGQVLPALAGACLFAIGAGIISPPVTAIFVMSFPTEVRATASGFIYNVATVGIGSTLPLIAAWLFGLTGSNVVVAIYLAVLCLISLLFTLKFTRHLGGVSFQHGSKARKGLVN